MEPEIELRMPDGVREHVRVRHVLNAGFSGSDETAVRHHVDELVELGVTPPGSVPTLYPLPAYLVAQTGEIPVPHARTSGEAEWALVIGDDESLLTVASDHTDRDLEVHGITWSKSTCPNVVGDLAWPLRDVDDLGSFTLRAWVTHDGTETLIQDGTLDALRTPAYWIDRLRDNGLLRPGTVLLGGTIAMRAGVDQFADAWRAEIADPRGNTSTVSYACRQLPAAWD